MNGFLRGGTVVLQLTRRVLSLALAGAVVLVPRLAAQAPRQGAGAVSAQIATGALGTLAGFVAGGLLTRAALGGADEDHASRVAYIGAYVGALLLTPVGPALIGNRGHATGSYTAAQVGTLLGAAGTVLLKRIGDGGILDCRACLPLRIIAGAGIVLLPSIGATVAFDRSREAER